MATAGAMRTPTYNMEVREVPETVPDYTAHLYSIQVKYCTGDEEEKRYAVRHARRIVRAAAAARLLAPVTAINEHCGKIAFEIPILDLAGGRPSCSACCWD